MTIGIDISVLNDKQKTGIAVYTYNLVDALLKINKKDKFILFGISTFEMFNCFKNLSFKNNPNVEMKIYKLPAKIFRIAFLLWQKLNWPDIENFVGEVDIFHSFNWYLPPQKKGLIVATVFDMTPLLFPKFHQQKTIQLETVRLNRIEGFADLVVTISENSKKDFLKFAPKKRIEVIYPAVSENFKIQKDQLKIKRVLKKYNIRPGYFLSVATLEPRKNIQGLIEAYLASNLDTQLVIVGGGGWKNESVNELLKKHKKNIIVTGFVPDEDLPILYSQALCLVYPSFYEGFGIPILEAMACGIPVICSKTSSLKEVGAEAVLYVDPGRVESMTGALIKISKDSNLRRELIRKGEIQAKKFSWEKSAKKLNVLYHAI